jgi:hypothetical protein
MPFRRSGRPPRPGRADRCPRPRRPNDRRPSVRSPSGSPSGTPRHPAAGRSRSRTVPGPEGRGCGAARSRAQRYGSIARRPSVPAAGPVPASYSLHCLQLPLRFSPLHGLPLRAAGPALRAGWSRRVLLPRSRGLLEKQLAQCVGGPGFPLTGGPPVAGGQPGECLGGAENRQQARPPGRHPGWGVARCRLLVRRRQVDRQTPHTRIRRVTSFFSRYRAIG